MALGDALRVRMNPHCADKKCQGEKKRNLILCNYRPKFLPGIRVTSCVSRKGWNFMSVTPVRGLSRNE